MRKVSKNQRDVDGQRRGGRELSRGRRGRAKSQRQDVSRELRKRRVCLWGGVREQTSGQDGGHHFQSNGSHGGYLRRLLNPCPGQDSIFF